MPELFLLSASIAYAVTISAVTRYNLFDTASITLFTHDDSSEGSKVARYSFRRLFVGFFLINICSSAFIALGYYETSQLDQEIGLRWISVMLILLSCHFFYGFPRLIHGFVFNDCFYDRDVRKKMSDNIWGVAIDDKWHNPWRHLLFAILYFAFGVGALYLSCYLHPK